MRILLLSDIHANLPALEAVLAHAGRYDDVWVLGDLVDYGPWPGEVIDTVRSLGPSVSVRGNHDHAAAYGVDCGCGPRTWRASVETRRLITLPKLSKGDLEYLANLPLKAQPAPTILAVHGSPRNPLHGYLHHKPDTIERELNPTLRLSKAKTPRNRKTLGYTLLVHGHTHKPGTTTYQEATLVNPGSVGQPRDGDPRASYAIIELDGDRVTGVRLHRVQYNIEKVVSAIRGLELPGWLKEWLTKTYLTGQVP